MTDTEYMRLALIEAEKCKNEVPVGAVIVLNGEVIARAHNERESSDGLGVIAHAEMLCIVRAASMLKTRRLKGCTLYVTLEPCPMCAGAMVLAGLDKCFFGAYDPAQGCCGSVYDLPEDPAFYHRVSCRGGLLSGECAALLSSFFVKKRETHLSDADLPGPTLPDDPAFSS